MGQQLWQTCPAVVFVCACGASNSCVELKRQGREVKDVARSEHSRAISEVKRLERHRGELMVVLRKQAKLIDVLRRQRAHLEAARLLAFTEDEFMRLLDVGAR
jgi:hypothetical protein